jgi:hypothetical protein
MQRIMSGRRDREAEAADWRREPAPAGASLGVLAARRREEPRGERR